MNQAAYIDVSIAAQLDLVVALGAIWYRVDVDAHNFQGNSARFDELVREAELRHLRLLPVLLPSPNCRNQEASQERIREAAMTFAKDIVGRYKGRISHWELGNEYDIYALIRKGEVTQSGVLWTWNGEPDGSSHDHYDQVRSARVKAELLGLYDGVKAADREAITIVNTAGWLHYGFIERLIAENPTNPFDIISWHWYSEMGPMTAVQGRLDLVAHLQRYGKPLWITETNRRDGSKGNKEADQADYIRQTIAQIGSNPGVAALFVYELLDEPNFGKEGESDYGLVTLTQHQDGRWRIGRKKEAFEAFQTVIAMDKRRP